MFLRSADYPQHCEYLSRKTAGFERGHARHGDDNATIVQFDFQHLYTLRESVSVVFCSHKSRLSKQNERRLSGASERQESPKIRVG